MKVILFGASGMVGQGVLRECLLADDVTQVLAVGRRPLGPAQPRLRELLREDFLDYADAEAELRGYDACFFCLGVSSLGLDEAEYTRVTYDYALAAARVLARLNPSMVFVFVSGAGTDASEQGKRMWARVKGRTENALRALPFRAVYLFRPGAIRPVHGVRSKTRWTQRFYNWTGPLTALARALFPRQVASTESIGRAMLEVVRHGAPQAVVPPAGIEALSRQAVARA